MRTTRLLLTVTSLVAVVQSYSRDASAQDVSAAAKAFAQAQAAELAGQPRRAAHLYELADRIVPSASALRSAARARMSSGDAAAAAAHGELLLARYPSDSKSRALAADLLRSLAPTLTRMTIRCDSPCSLSIGGAALSLDREVLHSFYIKPGEYRLTARFQGDRQNQLVFRGRPGQRLSYRIREPRATTRTSFASDNVTNRSRARVPRRTRTSRPLQDTSGLSRAWFYVGSLATVGLGAASAWSGLDVLARNRVYNENPTEEGYRDGLLRERRTNLLLGATAAMGVATLALLLNTDWSSHEELSDENSAGFVLVPTQRGGLVTVRGRF